MRPSYPLTRTGFSSISKGVFKNSETFLAHLVSRRAKAFALELAKAVVFTLHPLQDRVYRIVKLFLLINQLRSTSDISILFGFEIESFLKAALFLPDPLGSYLFPKLSKSYPAPSLGIP